MKSRYQKLQLDYDMVCPDCGHLLLDGDYVIYDREKDVEVCLECHDSNLGSSKL